MAKPKTYLNRETKFTGQYTREVYETLRFAYRPIQSRIASFLVLGFLGRFLLLSNANIVGTWVDSFCRAPAPCKPVPSLFRGLDNVDFLYILIAVTFTGVFLQAFYRIGFSRLSATAISRIYDEVTIRTSRLPISFFDTNPVGRIVTRFSSDYGNVFRLFGGPLAEFLVIISDLLSMIILIAIASPYYLPIVFLIGVANYLVYRRNRDTVRGVRRDLSAQRSPPIAHFAETTQGASTIRIFGRQGTFLSRFQRLNEQYLFQRLRTAKVLMLFSMQMSSLTAILLFATGLTGYYLSQMGLASVGSIGVAFTFIVLSGSSMQMFFEWMAQFEEAMTGVERLDEYLRRPLEAGSKLPATREFPTSHPAYAPGENEKLQRIRLTDAPAAGVSVRDLWFRYSPELPHVLKGLNIEIQPGEKIGVVGRTGSGKSSFVQALFHLYPFEQGQISISGLEPEVGRSISGTVDLDLYRRSIALISQDPTLFRGTVRENLDLSGVHEESLLLQALERVGMREWIEVQPEKLDTMIEERGRNLSSGERQLLCMARCLLQDAPVVVMDEATSSIDPQSEEILVRATREFFADRTQIIIAHRLSTLEHCDRILWLQKGEVRAFDRPEIVLPVFRETQLA